MGTSSAALFKNVTLSAVVEEERLSKKNDNSFSKFSNKRILAIESIKLALINF